MPPLFFLEHGGMASGTVFGIVTGKAPPVGDPGGFDDLGMLFQPTDRVFFPVAVAASRGRICSQ